ncbi:PDZ domain-containing protein [Candidatus Woesearchaeota archaeon]|nr:PDZ domain-containing protein [Candidatus Woesearchaeota archaeon]
MSKLKKFLTNTRIIILIVALLLAAIAIHPTLNDDGVAIRSVARNSSAAIAGFESPGPNVHPTQREVILKVDNQPVTDEESYHSLVDGLEPGDQVTITTNKKTYFVEVKPLYNITYLDEYENVTHEAYNETLNETVNVTVQQQKTLREVIGAEDIGLSVYARPINNVRKGLDLEGGTRVLLKPDEEVDEEELDIIIANIKQRLNVYGVSDIVVRPTRDLEGNAFISVEIAGVNKDEVRELLSQQGKFEAKVGQETVFLGGNDIAYVCRTADCSGIDPQRGCGQGADDQWHCSFRFSITLEPDAAERQAAATKDLDVIMEEDGEGYLSKNLSLYLDDQLVDELRISSGLKGSAQTQISITGGGSGGTQQEAMQNTLDNMKQLQTVLITGSLPVKLNIVKTDAISPALGRTFVKNIMLIALLAMLAVVVVVFIRYREWRISLPMIITMLSEVIILLGIASLIGWRLDLAAIAGIIIAVGTGVDHQIVIADETFKKRAEALSWQDKLKRAFFIIMAAYFTTLVAMLPLWFAGAGLLKGFALTTILGVSIGVFITRPAYATILETLINK